MVPLSVVFCIVSVALSKMTRRRRLLRHTHKQQNGPLLFSLFSMKKVKNLAKYSNGRMTHTISCFLHKDESIVYRYLS